MRQRKELPVWAWGCIAALGLFIVLALANEVRADTKVEIIGGHYGKHWVSENVTNEKHALVCLRVEWAIGCRFNNSYKQPGFSGESYALGVVKDWVLAENVNRWNGRIEAMGSIGLTYGYTEFAGHDPAKDKGVHGYAAPGLFYVQPQSWGEWKGGAILFGDDTIPTIGVGVTF